MHGVYVTLPGAVVVQSNVLLCSTIDDTSTPVSTARNEAAPVSMPLADGSIVIRRIIDSDNSCLFNAVGYVMEHTRYVLVTGRSVTK